MLYILLSNSTLVSKHNKSAGFALFNLEKKNHGNIGAGFPNHLLVDSNIGIDICTLLYIKYMTNTNSLYSTGCFTQYSVMT